MYQMDAKGQGKGCQSGPALLAKLVQMGPMSPASSDGPDRGFGSSDPSQDVEPEEATVTAEEEDRSGAVEIPLGMPGDPRTLAELKRRADEPDPDPIGEDEPQDC